MTEVPSNLIPTRISQLPVAPVADENSQMMIIYQGNNYRIRVGDLLSVAGVPITRQVIAGTGMTGGGQLSSNVTLSIAPGGVGSSELSATGVTPGVYGSSVTVPVLTIDANGRIAAATTQAIIGTGTVTSVGLSLPPEFNVTGSPVTDAGTLTATWATEDANYFFATPNGSSGAPSFRAILAADIPTLNQNTTGQAGSVVNSVTFTTTGGGSPGETFNGASPVTVDHSTIGAPSFTGDLATGTWGINISGNAATATTATSATSATAATNVAGGVANNLVYNTGTSTTSFIVAPTVAGSFLSWNGSAIVWNSNAIGTVTSVTGGSYLTGGTITTSGTLAVDATSANTASKVVARDASGNFSAGTITATLSGNASSATNVAGGAANRIVYNTNAGATSFVVAPTSGNTYLSWDGTAFAWSSVGGGTVTSVAAGTYLTGGTITTSGTLAVDATSNNTASKVVARDGSGNFSAGTITANLTGTASIATNVSGGAANRIVYNTASSSSSFVVAPTVASTFLNWTGSAFAWSAVPQGTVTSITAGTYLTGGTITGSGTIAVDATSANTASKVVARDASGNFSAGTITATLTGTASAATNLAGGAASQIPYQTGSGATTFLANGTAGQVLKSNGSSAPSWSGINGGTF